jgi:FkbH-like protein
MKSIRVIIRGSLILYHVLGMATLASVVLAAGCWAATAILGPLPAPVWIAACPVLYLTWLGLLLGASALNIQLIAKSGWQKPRRFESPAGGDETRDAVLVGAIMLRAPMIWSLPLARYLMRVPVLDRLLLYSYAPRVPIGRNVQMWGMLYDPELTHIGEGAVIGGDSTLSAHSLTTKPDGRLLYLSAPINIGARAVIGANSRVALGASIGSDAIILPGSSVLPYAQIPANQVWGGDPAVFIRCRDAADRGDLAGPTEPAQLEPAGATTALKIHDERLDEATEDVLVREIREIVAEALNLAAERVSPDFCCDDCAEWDSLAQMAIAAALYNRFGITVASAETFGLRSIETLCGLVRRRANSAAGAEQPTEELPVNPELIPLLETQTATRLLSQHASGDRQPPRHELDLVIAATFTADPLVPAITLWSRAFGVRVRTRMLGFNQVQESLLDAGGPLRKNAGLNLVLVRPEDVLAGGADSATERAAALLDALAQCARHSTGRLVVASMPPVVSNLQWFDASLVAKIRAMWNARIADNADWEVLDLSAVVENLGVAASRAQAMELETRSPYSPALYQELGRETARLIRKRYRASAKVLALDADNTLWGGVVAEDGAAAVDVGADGPGRSFQLFQEAALKLRERGVLLVLVSRNEPEDVWAVFDNHPGMRLKRSHITASRINWKAKSQNLKELAAELNLGLDSFVFVDDDPANRREVAANAPGVTVLPLPADPAEYCRALTQLWVFDSATRLTAEDRERPGMMQEEQERQQTRQAHAALGDYLRDLRLQVEMREATSFDLSRVAQLEQKTNQFNLTLARRTLDQLKTLGRSHSIYVVQAADRFGDYGLIGACVLAADAADSTVYRLDTLIMSCRALGRGIEEAVLDGLLREVKSRGGTQLVAEFVPGPRNEPVREFLRRAEFSEDAENRFVIAALGESRLPVHIEWVQKRSRLAG